MSEFQNQQLGLKILGAWTGIWGCQSGYPEPGWQMLGDRAGAAVRGKTSSHKGQFGSMDGSQRQPDCEDEDACSGY